MPVSLSPCFSPAHTRYSFINYLSKKSAFFLFFLSFFTRLHCPYPGTHTLIISLIISPRKIAKSEKDHLPQDPDSDSPRTSAPGRGSEWGTAGRPPSSLEERVWGWRTWLTPVRWWSGSQVKKHLVQWWEGGRTHARTLKTDTRLIAWVLLPSLMNTQMYTHRHSQTGFFISHKDNFFFLRSVSSADSGKWPP